MQVFIFSNYNKFSAHSTALLSKADCDNTNLKYSCFSSSYFPHFRVVLAVLEQDCYSNWRFIKKILIFGDYQAIFCLEFSVHHLFLLSSLQIFSDNLVLEGDLQMYVRKFFDFSVELSSFN